MDIPKLIERAQEAAAKGNYDYAVSLYQQVLAFQPDNGPARAEMLDALSKRWISKKLSPLTIRLFSLPQWLGVGFARISRSHENLIRACQRYQLVDPHNLSVNLRLGEALCKAGHLNAAITIYEFIHRLDPKNTEALKRAGLLKYRTKDIPGALAFYERVLAIHPRDAEAEKMRKNLAAEGTLASGSYSTARSSHELIKEKDEAVFQQRKDRIFKTSEEIDQEIAHLQSRIGSDPNNRQLKFDLAARFQRKKDYASARKIYRDLLDEDSESFEINCRLGDLEIQALSDEIQEMERQDRIDQANSLKRERLTKQISEYQWRVQAHPTDLGLWFAYGEYASQGGSVDEAIRAFQQSVKDPRQKIPSLHYLGKLFFKKKLYDLSAKQLEAALEASGGLSGKSKAIVYDLGRVAEAQNDEKTALNWYLKIFEIDINYKDVASKIEALRTI
ncbi:MAG: tetratricopeptide repeat protein [Planctomycetes bacterium]|nr:tetratricopeptide repeat protein [Planctomycetota bacterium]